MAPSRGTRKAERRRCTEALRDLVLGYRGRVEDGLRGSGVSLPQLRMLKAIGQQDKGSAAQIARQCQVTPQTLHSMLARAEREGWIARGTSERNQRFVTATLTAKGADLVAQGLVLAERVEAEIWKGVSQAQLEGTRETLEAALANLKNARKPQADG